ncbi:PML-RARA-regulated adapter molecule 1 [Gracilinanus agilis]|uniref:PML-RARA-regulated adapter molecule 1 n=1 Tax=Gracilinanus agilis TaxID=191870 RepID=UPI001CFD0E23|nr:PML-RARA-regulated adapter molecule 1 [Gracilinanus agilis]
MAELPVSGVRECGRKHEVMAGGNGSHQDFQNLKAKFQGLQAGFSEVPKKPPLPKGSQLPGLGRAHPAPEGSPAARAPDTNQRRPPWQRKELGQGVPRRRPLPPLKTLGPQPPKPPLPPGTLHLEQFRRTAAFAHQVPRREPSSLASSDDLLVAERTLKDFQPRGLQLRSSWKSSEEDKVKEIPKALKPLKQYKKEEKAEREFRKKFKFEGDIVTLTRMMIDPNANTRRGGGRNLAIRRGEILDVIQFTSREQILCRDVRGKYGFIPRTALLPLETEVYDDVSF